MRIGIDASGIFGWRGPSRNIRNLIRHLLQIDDRNHYFLFVPQEPTLELEEKQNFTWVLIKKKTFVPWLSVVLPLAAIRRKVDVMVFPHSNFWILKPFNIKTIVFIRYGSFYAWHDNATEHLSVFFRKWRLKKVADRVVVVSRFLEKQIQFSFGISEERIRVIYNAPDPIFNNEEIPLTNRFGTYMLFVGGFEDNKNLMRLIQAFEKIVSKNIEVKLLIVGGEYVPTLATPPIEACCERSDKLRNNVIFHGVETDSKKLASLYKSAELVVFPSLYETFGLISVEAMAIGTPLVASRMPAIPEIAGDAAEYFDPYDVDEMAEKIEKVLKDEMLRKSLIAEGKERIKKFKWEESAKSVIAVIGEVVEDR